MPRTVQQPDSLDRSRQIREWIVALAENFGADLSVARIDLLEAGLADLHLEQIHTAFKLCALRRERFFPSLAELRGYVDGGTKQAADAIDDELVWQKILEYCRKFVRPDILRPAPPSEDADDQTKRMYPAKWGPPLPAAWEFAARVAGGLAFLERCSERDLIFAKQRFLEALTRWREGSENFGQLPEGPVKKLISGIAAAKQLPAVDAYDASRARGEQDRAQFATRGAPDLSLEERLADELAIAARKVLEQSREHERIVAVSDETRKALRYQTELIRSRYPNERSTDPRLREYLAASHRSLRAAPADGKAGHALRRKSSGATKRTSRSATRGKIRL